jgi:hypothetical protein
MTNDFTICAARADSWVCERRHAEFIAREGKDVDSWYIAAMPNCTAFIKLEAK